MAAPASITLLEPTPRARKRAGTPPRLPSTPAWTSRHQRSWLANTTNVVQFNSGLPVIILHNNGQGTVPSSKAEQYVVIQVFDTEYGRSSMTNLPSLTGRGVFHVRGSSTAVASSSKAAFVLEFRDELNNDTEKPLLGLPEE